MGVYLVPELLKQGYRVDITTRSAGYRSGVNVRYIQGNACDTDFLVQVLASNYDAVVDFMVYPTTEFSKRIDILLESTSQYIFLSTYRVYADSKGPIRESSPRLLDVSEDKTYLETDEYALQKARQEDILRTHARKNWTIVRPSITYSKNRFQLGVLEAGVVVRRSLEGKSVVFPMEMLEKTTTMTWAGDVAKMISRLVLNDSALQEDFNVVTSEHHTWSEVARYYSSNIGLKIRHITLERFLQIYDNPYQVQYDRMYNRRMDNSKVLAATGLEQGDLMSLEQGLRRELQYFLSDPKFSDLHQELNNRMDVFTDVSVQKIRKKLRPRSRIREARSKIRIRNRLKDIKQKTRIRTRLKVLAATRQNAQKDGVILTMNSIFNYGNVAQRYALQTVLKEYGYTFDNVNMPGWYDAVGDEIFGEMRHFVAKYIGGVPYDPDMLQGYGAYIVGSDQVWRKWGDVDWEVYTRYFFAFIKDSQAKRISYAASFGVDSLSEAGIDSSKVDELGELLGRFTAISVREKSGAQLVDELMSAKVSRSSVVLDPTLLLTSKNYSDLIDESKVSDTRTARVFCYVIDQTDEKKRLVQEVAKDYGHDFYILHPRFDREYEPVEWWLKGFRDSDFVITDSFHGTVFAIINHKNFVVFNNSMRGSARFETLLDSMGISKSRLVHSDVTASAIKSMQLIDWAEVDARLEALRGTSLEWLQSALGKK